MTATILLGPQRFLTTAGAVVRGLGTDGPVATVTAGWQDREGDDSELQDVMEGRSRNLHLYGRMIDVLTQDARVADVAMAVQDATRDLASVYSTRLHHALAAVFAVQRHPGRHDVVGAGLDDAVESVRRLDRWYLQELRELYEDGDLVAALDASELLARHRAEVAGILSGSSVLAVAGGHVGVLIRGLRLFAVRPSAELPVVAWSGGAMAVTERVILFHDDTPQGFSGAEIWDRGLGRARGIVALPHARRRLRLDDASRVSVMARRFAGATCVLLEDGSRVALGPGGELPPRTRYLSVDGSVATVGEER